MRKFFLLLIAAITLGLTATAQTVRKFTLTNSSDGKSELTVYLPSADALSKANGRCIVDCPGGGYSHLAMEHEGHKWAPFYNAKGCAFVVLRYRMPEGNRNIPLSDAYNAIRTVRDSAQAWHINPHNVGIQGFSAGGHLASAVSTHAPFDVRPDFSILFYPVISMNEQVSHKGSCNNFLGDKRNDPEMQKEWSSDKAVRRHLTPPAIVILANDDRVVPPATNGAAYYTAMRSAGNNCSMFAYPTGGHGFGFRDTWRYHDLMLQELSQWLDDLPMPSDSALKVACIGNSITDGHGIDMSEIYGYPACLAKELGNGYYVKNFGVSARTMSNSGNHPYQKEPAWHACLEWQPDIVVIKLGTNDTKEINWPTAQEDFIPSLAHMVDSLHALPSHPRIIVCSPIPAVSHNFSIRDSITLNCELPMLQQFTKKNRLEYLDLYTLFGKLSGFPDKLMIRDDGVHPNDKGAAKLASLVADRIRISSQRKKQK